jgi:hypothetical protein
MINFNLDTVCWARTFVRQHLVAAIDQMTQGNGSTQISDKYRETIENNIKFIQKCAEERLLEGTSDRFTRVWNTPGGVILLLILFLPY